MATTTIILDPATQCSVSFAVALSVVSSRARDDVAFRVRVIALIATRYKTDIGTVCSSEMRSITCCVKAVVLAIMNAEEYRVYCPDTESVEPANPIRHHVSPILSRVPGTPITRKRRFDTVRTPPRA